MKTAYVEEILKRSGAILEGHFLLSSGLHSAKYIQCALALQHPDLAERLSGALAAKFKEEKIDLIISPAVGGIVVGQEVARALGVRAIFAEREAGKMELRRGFKIGKGERALVVEDVITTGGSVKEVIALAQEQGAAVVGVGALIDRSSGKVNFDVAFKSLLSLEIEAFSPDICPLCKKSLPLVKPGSRK